MQFNINPSSLTGTRKPQFNAGVNKAKIVEAGFEFANNMQEGAKAVWQKVKSITETAAGFDIVPLVGSPVQLRATDFGKGKKNLVRLVVKFKCLEEGNEQAEFDTTVLFSPISPDAMEFCNRTGIKDMQGAKEHFSKLYSTKVAYANWSKPEQELNSYKKGKEDVFKLVINLLASQGITNIGDLVNYNELNKTLQELINSEVAIRVYKNESGFTTLGKHPSIAANTAEGIESIQKHPAAEITAMEKFAAKKAEAEAASGDDDLPF